MYDLNAHLRRLWVNARGWRTRRRLLVLDSDDWGSVRMPDQRVKARLLAAGLRVDQCPYMSLDSLASADDLQALFGLLRGVRDRHGQHPVLTANCVMANPDFEAIRRNGFATYYFELFTETLKRYPGCESSFKLWQQGMADGLFKPQFHGREHLNVARWMRALKEGVKVVHRAFDLGVFGISRQLSSELPSSLLEAYAVDTPDDVAAVDAIIAEGLSLFKMLFGCSPQSFIAPNYVWSSSNERIASAQGVLFIKGQRRQVLPIYQGTRSRLVTHYTGEENALGQHYLVRNSFFEPALYPGKDSSGSCLTQIAAAFALGKPAIVCSHRLNFIGGLREENRCRNLEMLGVVLKTVLKRWPDVEFVSSDQLGSIIRNFE